MPGRGPEYVSELLATRARTCCIGLQILRPGKPQRNACVERYNRTVRCDWLNQYIFENIEDVQPAATTWLWTYDNERPNMAIGHITPKQKIAMDMIKLLAFDLDGTLYLGEKAISGAVETVASLQDKFRVCFFTNNSTKSNPEITDKLNNLGFSCEARDVYTSSLSTATYLTTQGLDQVYVIGSDGFKKELASHGLTLVDDETAKNLVVGLDLDFSYQKIAVALQILKNGGKFIACNEDANFPVGSEIVKPGCGAMVGAIRSSSQRSPDFIVGKPNPYILSVIATENAVRNDEVVVIGDSPESDIKMALNFGCPSVLFDYGGPSSADHEGLRMTDIRELPGMLEIL
jgi:HAD superfamily hydrolase (TIGR01450 family)